MKSRLAIINSVFLFVGLFVTGNLSARIFPSPQINNRDTIVFDMANAVMTGNIIDIPIYFSSFDTISALDFALKYNELNIRFDSIINYSDNTTPLANFNTSDRYLRFTSNTGIAVPFDKNTALFALRFHFVNSGPCQQITTSDLDSITALLNGDICSYGITKAPPFRVPKAGFTNNNACSGTAVNFKDASQIVQGKIVSWAWNFGNGKTATGKSPAAVTYSSLSTYKVSLVVTSNIGCKDSISKFINVNPTPSANFASSVSCQTGKATFTDYSTPSGNIATWNWDFGDHNQSNSKNPTYNYYSNGTYTASLTVTSDSGCSATFSKALTVSVLQARFSAVNRCIEATTNFIDSSTTSATSGSIAKWKWDLGDGTTSSSQNPSNIYYTSGDYVVSLKVSNNNCSDSTSKVITIDDRSTVKFAESKISGCMPLTINFSDSSITTAGSSYSWDFGDKDTSILQNPDHIYTTNGNYTIRLIVTTPGGCIDTSTQSSAIKVYGSPVTFSVSPQKIKLPDAKVQFTNLTKVYTQWKWSFGDDSSIFSTEKSPQHNYTNAGIYKVCLTGSGSDGCVNYYCDSITVLNPNVVAIPNAFTPNGDNLNDSLFVRGGPVKEMELRIFNELGNLVFYSNEQSKGWDGTYKGTPQTAGAYEYSIKGKTEDEESLNLHGIVNLIR